MTSNKIKEYLLPFLKLGIVVQFLLARNIIRYWNIKHCQQAGVEREYSTTINQQAVNRKS